MKHWFQNILVCAAVVLAAVPASADVQLRVGVRPDTLSQCSMGHAFAAIANTGTHRIMARLCLRMVHADSTIIGPICGRIALAPGERRMRDFSFLVPPRMPVGNYAIVVNAFASDSTSDRAAAPFVVIPGACTISATPGSTGDDPDRKSTV